jgi:NUC153 domain
MYEVALRVAGQWRTSVVRGACVGQVNAAAAARLMLGRKGGAAADDDDDDEEDAGGEPSKRRRLAADPMADDRFKAMFEDEDFAIDEEADDYKILHPNAGACSAATARRACLLEVSLATLLLSAWFHGVQLMPSSVHAMR